MFVINTKYKVSKNYVIVPNILFLTIRFLDAGFIVLGLYKPIVPSCCAQTTVGGILYTLAGKMDTSVYNCKSDCVYNREDEPGINYCMGQGDMEVKCIEVERPEETQDETNCTIFEPILHFPCYSESMVMTAIKELQVINEALIKLKASQEATTQCLLEILESLTT